MFVIFANAWARRILVSSALLLPAVTGTPLFAEVPDLKAYAAACKIPIPVDIPSFSCLDGKEVSMEGAEGGTCDAPPYLPQAGCYKHSRFGVLASTPDLGVVFMCRHKRPAKPGDNTWDDIAVIATRFSTGATCFFQQLDEAGGLPGDVKAPSTGEGAWIPPKEMAGEKHACVQCHDNGAFLRTPYLKPVIDPLPLFENFKKRNRNKYWFPGSEFLFFEQGKNWNGNVLKVTHSDAALCSSCHAMGVTTIDKNVGTSTWLGLFSTGFNPTKALRKGAGPKQDEAYWMKPNLSAPEDGSKAKSKSLQSCALESTSSGKCAQTPFEGQAGELSRLAQDLISQRQAEQQP